jgi:uncharacterized protein YbjQ (UPF0145 family)
MSEALAIITWFALPILIPLLFTSTSWALGRWYQGRLLRALEVSEKSTGVMFQNPSVLSTSEHHGALNAPSAVLLHVSVCVGPSMGQMFFMWVKSIFGGRLESYDGVLNYGRREALLRLQRQAEALQCSSMVNVRLETSVVSFAKNQKSKQASVEFLAFATGLRS